MSSCLGAGIPIFASEQEDPILRYRWHTFDVFDYGAVPGISVIRVKLIVLIAKRERNGKITKLHLSDNSLNNLQTNDVVVAWSSGAFENKQG